MDAFAYEEFSTFLTYFKLNSLNKDSSQDKLFELIMNILGKSFSYEFGRYDSSKLYALLITLQIFNKNMDISNDYLKNFITEIGEFIVVKNNNLISGETLMEAVENIYQECYGYSGESLASKMSEILNQNKERQKRCFPVRYKVLVDGTKIPIENEVNKFDIEMNKQNNRSL